jgi:hypothetical protein
MSIMFNIKHSSIEDWRNGPRVDLFTIEHPVLNDDGTPVMVNDPDWIAPVSDASVGDPIAVAPQVPQVDRTVYSMPEKPNAGFALIYLKTIRTMGAEQSLGWLFELAIGEEAYDALAGESDFSIEQLNALMLDVQKRALGGLEAPKG